jgi:DNA polymerase-3 subunit gamma/tau
MAKKKSKGFIVPSINFITMHRAPKTSEPAPTVSEDVQVSTVESERQEVEEKKPEPVKAKLVKPAQLETAGNGRRKSALSLSSLKRNKEEEEELRQKRAHEKKNEDLPNDPFTHEAFHKVWQDYVDSLHVEGEKILASILMADKPELKQQMIHLTYPNQLMKTELLRVRPKVLKHIRKALNNHSIDFVVEVKEGNTKRFAYTPQEKYELLKEKNSAISLLRKKFNLEL